MTGAAPTVSAATWTERYETLRRYVVEGRQRLQSQPLGMALWLAKGMAGWMRQWSQFLEPATARASTLRRPDMAQPGLWQPALTLLLAHITLQHLEPRVSA